MSTEPPASTEPSLRPGTSGGSVYVSSSRADAAFVEPLIRAITAHGLAVYSDRDLQPGSDWAARLDDMFDQADAVLVVWSDDSRTSSYVIAEASRAQAAKKIVPVTVNGLAAVPPPFTSLQTVDLSGWKGDINARVLTPLLAALDRLAARTERSTAPLPPAESKRSSQAVTPESPPPPDGQRPTVDPELFSRSVRDLQRAFREPTTASALAAELRQHHPGYARGEFGKAELHPAEGMVAPVDTWLAQVGDLFDEQEVASSASGGVIDGQMFITGLAQLDPVLARDLENSGLAGILDAELAVHPRRRTPAGAEPEVELVLGETEAETDIGFAADLVAEQQPITAQQDLLGIEDDVQTLSRLILARSTQPPLAIGLFGSWGTGKSFFLQRMRTCMRELADDASRSSSTGTTYCEQVVSITFNAWHYLDADLWAGLASRIYRSIVGTGGETDEFRRKWFEDLATTGGARDAAKAESARAQQQLIDVKKELADREAKLGRIRAGRFTVEDAVAAIDLVTAPADRRPEATRPAGTDTELARTVADAQFGRGLVTSAIRRTTARSKVITAVVAVIIVILLGWLAVADKLAPATAALTAVFAVVSAPIVSSLKALRELRTQANQAQQLLDDADTRLRADADALRIRLDEANARQQAAERSLTELRDGSLVQRYLDERVQSAPYRDRLGLVSLVREDLERLTALLDPTTPDSVDASIDRIVLYIDDLDRCSPKRVVEVLQAVHLLLAFPLFVVVVAVEHRWLLTCLELHYRKLLGRDTEAVARLKEWELTPTDYLEKIFQVPLVLRPMSVDGYRRLVGSLAPIRVPAEPQAAFVETGSAAAAMPPVPAEPGTSTAQPIRDVVAVEPISVFEKPLTGSLLLVTFCPGGKRLAAVTTAGIWRWDRGRADRLSSVLTGELVSAAASPDGAVVAIIGSDNSARVVDLRTGQQRLLSRPANSRLLAVVPADFDWVLALSAEGLELHAGAKPSFVTGSFQSVTAPADHTAVVVERERLRRIAILSDGVVQDLPTPADDRVEGDLVVAISSGSEVLVSSRQGLTWFHGSADPVSGGVGGTDTTITAPVGPPGVAPMAARSSEGWWYSGEQGALWCWSEPGTSPSRSAFTVVGDRLAAHQDCPLVAAWGTEGFDVFDRNGIGFHRRGLAVEGAAMSPLGSLLATVAAGTLTLWRVNGSRGPEQPSQLELEPEEADFLGQLGPLVSTPRQAKRLINIFRLLRGSRVGRSRLADPGTADYRLAMLLLALAVSWPDEAALMFAALDAARQPGDTGPDGPSGREVVLTAISGSEVAGPFGELSDFPTPTALSSYVEWAGHVRRYYINPHGTGRQTMGSTGPAT